MAHGVDELGAGPAGGKGGEGGYAGLTDLWQSRALGILTASWLNGLVDAFLHYCVTAVRLLTVVVRAA
jgi:hypothetical protein